MFAYACTLCYVGIRRILVSLQKLPNWIESDLLCELWKEGENESLHKLGLFLFSSFLPIERITQSFMQLSRSFPFDKTLK